MRKIHIVGLALVAVLAFCAFSAVSASAAEWLVCEKMVGGKFKNAACSEAGAGEWEWKAILTPLPVDSAGTLELEDMNAPFKPVLICKGENEGTVGPGAVDLITKINKISCTSTFCSSPEAKPVNLPWKTELLPVGATIRDDILEDPELKPGLPGWEAICSGVKDICTTGAGSTLMKNEVSGTLGLVDALFEANSGTANCTVGGANQGLVNGLLLILSTTAGLGIGVT